MVHTGKWSEDTVLPDRARLAVQERRLRPLDSRDETRVSAFFRSVSRVLCTIVSVHAKLSESVFTSQNSKKRPFEALLLKCYTICYKI